MPKITMRGPAEFIKPLKADGTENPYYGLVTYIAVRATGRDSDIDIDVIGDEATISGITDASDISLPLIAGLALDGVEVYGYPVWIALPTSGLNEVVPDALPNSKMADGTPVTWVDWKAPNHTYYTSADGLTTYIGGNASDSQELPGSVIAALLGGGYDLKTADEFKAILASEASPE